MQPQPRVKILISLTSPRSQRLNLRAAAEHLRTTGVLTAAQANLRHFSSV
jgi:hypothetical protein